MMDFPAKTKVQLKDLLQMERALYMPSGNYGKHKLRHSKAFSLYCALRALREYEFCCHQRDTATSYFSRKYYSLKVIWLDRKRNILCEKAGIELTPEHIGPCVRIWHSGVVIYGHVGEGCVFHGNNVIGNKRSGSPDDVPRLGKRVDLGFGACIIGKVEIANDCVIGAGAVVTKSFLVPGTVIAGVPAKAIGQVTHNG